MMIRKTPFVASSVRFWSSAPGEEMLEIELPYPFVTQGANPVRIYESVTPDDGYFTPGDEIGSAKTLVALTDYAPQQNRPN